MTIDVDGLQSFTDAELLKLVRLAIAEIAYHGQLVTVRNKQIQSATIGELQKLEAQLQSRVNAASTGRVKNYARRKRV